MTYILELIIFNFQNVSLQCALWFSPTWLLQLHSPHECHPHPSQFPIKNGVNGQYIATSFHTAGLLMQKLCTKSDRKTTCVFASQADIKMPSKL